MFHFKSVLKTSAQRVPIMKKSLSVFIGVLS